jgi:hypothetical protein
MSTMAPCRRRISTTLRHPLAAAKCKGVEPVVPTVCLEERKIKRREYIRSSIHR